MNSDLHTTTPACCVAPHGGAGSSGDVSVAAADTGRRSRRLGLAALALAAVLGVSACTSQPSSRRIARDLVETLTEPGPKRDCLLEKLDSYSDDQLDEITKSADDTGPGTALDLFEADLASCP